MGSERRATSRGCLFWLEQWFCSISTIQCYQEGLIAESRPYVFNAISNLVWNASKNEYLFVGLVITNNSHTMVTHVCKSIAIDRILHIEPDLLIEHEQDQVV